MKTVLTSLNSILFLLVTGIGALPVSAFATDQTVQDLQGTPTPPVSTPQNMIDNPPEDKAFDVPTLEEQQGAASGKAIPQMKNSINNTAAAITSAKRSDELSKEKSREEAKQINLLLLKKGLIKQQPMGSAMYSVGAAGTESNAALEQVQKAVGLYPNETSLPDGDSAKINAGKPTPLTMAAIGALPNGDGTQYTQSDIDAAKQAIQNKQDELNSTTSSAPSKPVPGEIIAQPAEPANPTKDNNGAIQ